jgi:hypothetical protein
VYNIKDDALLLVEKSNLAFWRPVESSHPWLPSFDIEAVKWRWVVDEDQDATRVILPSMIVSKIWPTVTKQSPLDVEAPV